MNRRQLTRVHLCSAIGAVALVGSLLVSSAVTELAGSTVALRDLRLAIVLAMPALIACLAGAGITGSRLAGKSRAVVVRRKLSRMRVIAAAGAGVLVPCAIVLSLRSTGTTALALEITELAAGALNFALLVLNVRDGRRLTAVRRARRRARRRPGFPTAATRMVDTSL